MTKDKKSGFFGKLLGGKKSESCCTMELEEISGTEPGPAEKAEEKEPENKEKKNPCCGCGC